MAFVGTRRALLVGQNVTYSAAANALFAAMTTPPSAARKATINTLILALQSAGVWSLLDVLYLTAAADSQAALLNWKNPAAFTLLPVNAPTFQTDRGYTGNGSTSRLRTQFTPSANGVNFTQNNASMWLWSLSGSGSANVDVGSQAAPACRMTVHTAGNLLNFFINDATSNNAANNNDTGFFGIQRPDSATKKAFAVGAQIGTASVASTGVCAVEQWMLGSNSGVFSARQEGAAAWGASLAGKEAAFYSAMLAYMQAVGAA